MVLLAWLNLDACSSLAVFIHTSLKALNLRSYSSKALKPYGPGALKP